MALSLLVVSAPAQAATLTSGQIGAIVMLLQSFGADPGVISSVQATLSGGASGSIGTSSTTPPGAPIGMPGMPPGQTGKMACIALNRDLGEGSRGDDVKELQQILEQDPNSGFTGTATGFFGPMTQRAMMHFQLNNGIASSSKANGMVGPMTRGFFERRCGEGLGNGQGDRGGDHGMGGMITGTISANNTSSVVVSNSNGQSRTVNITASTTIQVFAGTSTAPTMGTIANLTVGSTVAADGMLQQDGSLNAVHIRVGTSPQLMMQGDGDSHGGPQGGWSQGQGGQGGWGDH